jgi:hypothetical protein
VDKRTPKTGLGSLGSGAVTAVALAVQTGLAAVVGVVLGREFGRGPETDGFFAAYGVFVVVVLAANAIRVTVLPAFARAREDGRLGGELAAFSASLTVLLAPILVVSFVLAIPIADLLTGDRGALARDTAADALPWMILAATCQVYAGLAASALAAFDDYLTAAAGFVLGSVAGLLCILLRVDADGVQALSYGMALNGALALGVPALALALRARRGGTPAGAMRPGGAGALERFVAMGSGVALPLALQAIYLVCVPLASREGDGALTTFGYAYLIASALVAVTASSVGLVTAVPLSRAGLDPPRAARHVVASAWIAVVVIGGVTGVFALAGSGIAEAVLGDRYAGDAGGDLGRLVAVFSAWAVVTVGVSVTFPLVFVAERSRALPLVALAALAAHVPLAIAGWRLAALDGLAVALALTTGAVLVLLLRQLGAVRPAGLGLSLVAAIAAGGVALAFVPPWLLLPPVPAAAAGAILYVILFAVVRPRGLRDAWCYLRALA